MWWRYRSKTITVDVVEIQEVERGGQKECVVGHPKATAAIRECTAAKAGKQQTDTRAVATVAQKVSETYNVIAAQDPQRAGGSLISMSCPFKYSGSSIYATAWQGI